MKLIDTITQCDSEFYPLHMELYDGVVQVESST